MLFRRSWLQRVVFALGVVACSAPMAAQDLDLYRELVARGSAQPKASTAALARLGRETIERGVAFCTSEDRATHRLHCSPRELMAAAMLHADGADAAFTASPDTAVMLIDTATQLLAPLLPKAQPPVEGRTELMDQFIPRWYAYVARLCSAYGYTKRAREVVFDGMSRFEKSADLHVARGVVTERVVELSHPDLKGDLLRGGFTRKWMRGARSDPADTAQWLESAATDFRRAIELQPTHISANIRLGWIHLLLDDGRTTRDLTRLLTVVSDSRDRYLALLLRGAVAEGHGRMTDALRDYDEARNVGPSYQTACVASVHARYVTGDRTRAQQTASECLTLPPASDGPDPWWAFRVGLAEPTLGEWLRGVAWQR
ncbi:MAG: hypothetical protein ABMA15_09285 [Vicinamibacterales bacterium]